jgi:hypothetical protein
MYRRSLPILALMMIALLLAACNGGGLGGPAPTPTATPIPPTPTPNAGLVSTSTAAIAIPGSMATVSLGNDVAESLTANQDGLILAGAAKGSSINNSAGVASLLYLGFSAKTPQVLATATPATDKTVRGITTFIGGGDWAVYVLQGQQGQDWELWAVNVTNNTKMMIDSATQEKGSGILADDFATDGTDVVWAVPVAGQNISVLHAYDLTTNAVRTLLSVPAGAFSNLVMANQLLFYQVTTDGAAATPSPTPGATGTPAPTATPAPVTPVTTSWLWLLTQPHATQLNAQVLGNAALNSHYLAWYESDPAVMDFYDIFTGKTQQVSENPCVDPVLAPDRPYLGCLDDVDDQYQVMRTPSGTSAAFGLHATGGFGALANGRVYWIPEPNPLSSNSVVDYFSLPTK